MGKNKKYKQSSQSSKNPQSQASTSSVAAVPPKSPQPKSTSSQNSQEGFSPIQRQPVQPEQMSLVAHQHIQCYLNSRPALTDNDLTAVLRLSQHLRVFGLLSAAGYVNQSNSQGGEVRERTVPVWESLLGQLVDEANPPDRRNLMERVIALANNQPGEYMALWRKALVLANHWNFWARAYKE